MCHYLYYYLITSRKFLFRNWATFQDEFPYYTIARKCNQLTEAWCHSTIKMWCLRLLALLLSSFDFFVNIVCHSGYFANYCRPYSTPTRWVNMQCFTVKWKKKKKSKFDLSTLGENWKRWHDRSIPAQGLYRVTGTAHLSLCIGLYF